MVKIRRPNGEEHEKRKGLDTEELRTLKQKLGHDTTPDNERRRPRNRTEWKWLKKWEHERGGKKIGNIGPPPEGLDDFDPATWDPKQDEDLIKFEDALKEGMEQYDDALNNLKDR